MGRFVDAALAFPTVLFTFPLLVVIAYWLLVAVGAVGFDGDLGGIPDTGVPDTGLGGTADASGTAGTGGFLGGLGLGGVPVAVVVSSLTVVAWFAGLVGGVLFTGTPALVGVLLVALLCAWACTRVIVALLRRTAPKERVPSRADFVGRMCVVRTTRVGKDFGQAEVTSPDGSSALVQVRQTGDDVFAAGSTALIFAYDAPGEFFWVMPYDAELDPHRL
ncbi:hypothetical protein FHS43_001127 [Streptosporangium becharense]|uniref:DUF1449 domain-containing protein n=1 Tax=Streptosporangium becharense TaxID=1816182 RepID=A0A7W9MG81_9ACTN|nr:OB-fold-containig protein [Streptosporangium becharense]MBB2909881.1 hypothetical protein [Streptosporangium becharense]MBB5819164.1 hypothetical protein [Streptosporangium becharense]